MKLLEHLRRLASELPGAEEYVMVHHPAFRVGKKPYAIVGLRGTVASTLSVNLGPAEQGDLLDDERFVRTPYLGRHGWVSIEVKTASAREIDSLVTESWRRVAGKKHLASHAAKRGSKAR